MKNWIKLVLCILLPLSVGAISGFATMESISGWYRQLQKPSFNPPDFLFGPVWTTLYILMGISFYLILRSDSQAWKKKPGTVFLTQLALNFAWSFIFFKFHLTGVALAEIILLWLSILWMILTFYKINRAAGFLQLFYLAWVSFATLLNASIHFLNN